MDIIDTILQNIPLIVMAGAEMVVGLVKGIVAAIPVLIDAMPAVIESIVYGLLDGIDTIILAGTELLSGIVKAIPGIIASLNEAIPEIISTIITALQRNLPIIIEAGMELLDGLIQAIPCSSGSAYYCTSSTHQLNSRNLNDWPAHAHRSWIGDIQRTGNKYAGNH